MPPGATISAPQTRSSLHDSSQRYGIRTMPDTFALGLVAIEKHKEHFLERWKR